MEELEKNKNRVLKVLFVFLIILSVYFVAKTFLQLKGGKMRIDGAAKPSISFSGHGEVTASADIASIYFTIRQKAKTALEAQTKVAEIEKKALDFLKTKSVEDKDIQAANVSFYPVYENKYRSYPPNFEQVIVGYEASESITVKVRNVDDVSVIIQGLGSAGVSDLNGPNFAIDNEDGLKREARKKAIDDAKKKAEILADDLDVRLGRIINFSEGEGYGGLIYYGKDAMTESGAGIPVPAQIPKGENIISSDVTITYEIR